MNLLCNHAKKNKKSFVFLLIGLLSLSCSEQKTRTLLIKQWHLSSSTETLDLEKAKLLPQFENQKDIYKFLETRILAGDLKTIIAEGCEGEIDKNFSLKFNGWTLQMLQEKKISKDYDDIMAPIPMKIKAKYPTVKVICGDNQSLITKNLKAMSDLRGFTGFYQRLLENKTNQKKYQAYEAQLRTLFPTEKIESPEQFALQKAIDALNQFESYIHQRNDSFIEIIKRYKNKNTAVVIGGLHVKDLSLKLIKKKISNEIMTPKGYASTEHKLIMSLKESLLSSLHQALSFFQTPEGFDFKNFPLSNKIKEDLIFNESELKKMKEKLKKFPGIFELLLSDYDQDGVRDFTLSSSPTGEIITAEDSDWDNDGVANILDDTVGETIVGKKVELKVSNHFFSSVDEKVLLKKIDKTFKIVPSEKVHHELLVIELLEKIHPYFKNGQLKYIRATRPIFSYGKNVFFSYIKHTNTLEYYPEKLSQYINSEYQKRFKGVQFNIFINSYVVPIIVHSLAHELAHSLEIDELALAKKNGWSWNEKEYLGKYLKEMRSPDKRMNILRTQFRYHGKTYQQWIAMYNQYKKLLDRAFKEKGLARQNMLKQSIYATGEKSKRDEHLVSFYHKFAIPSLYAFSKPGEWFAENYAACIYQLIYPKSVEKRRSIELEHLISFSPAARTTSITCSL